MGEMRIMVILGFLGAGCVCNHDATWR